MDSMLLQDVCEAVGGIQLAPAGDAAVRAVCTDTRHMEPGSLFIALKGENFNAHEFLKTAAARGAVAAIVQEATRVLRGRIAVV